MSVGDIAPVYAVVEVSQVELYIGRILAIICVPQKDGDRHLLRDAGNKLIVNDGLQTCRMYDRL